MPNKDILVVTGTSSDPRKKIMGLNKSTKGRIWEKNISSGCGGWRREADRSESETGNCCGQCREKRIVKVPLGQSVLFIGIENIATSLVFRLETHKENNLCRREIRRTGSLKGFPSLCVEEKDLVSE
ncbi:hypothetical protein AV530_011779 [Patagioenas fasciata monilis]|uniref:Uncharacterized protein n=1 Tax=Patagioenas fasciata monilis TaxID=372326 RepID=A0A1V4KLR4_PATFA|nr:hypothetical protein AV530_011779 [Patagioenas fasciata monilis]